MDELEKVVYMNKLIQIYGELLTNTQLEMMSDYYMANLSLNEIASERGVSKAAVEDAIKKASEKLLKYEKTLQILDKKESISKLLKEMNAENLEDIKEEIERRL